jgi:SARP family transcriptional regulator, regulator of embCAB operon
MTALYSAGYTERAPGEFHRLRSVLRAELGIEPAPKLQKLHLALLSGTAIPEPTTSIGRGAASAASGD